MQKKYKSVTAAGAAGITCGIISILCGVTVGVIMIVSGGRLLATRRELER